MMLRISTQFGSVYIISIHFDIKVGAELGSKIESYHWQGNLNYSFF